MSSNVGETVTPPTGGVGWVVRMGARGSGVKRSCRCFVSLVPL